MCVCAYQSQCTCGGQRTHCSAISFHHMSLRVIRCRRLGGGCLCPLHHPPGLVSLVWFSAPHSWQRAWSTVSLAHTDECADLISLHCNLSLHPESLSSLLSSANHPLLICSGSSAPAHTCLSLLAIQCHHSCQLVHTHTLYHLLWSSPYGHDPVSDNYISSSVQPLNCLIRH